MSLPFSVKGKSALLTGAGSGITLSFARLLLSKGCNVLIADIALRPEAQTLLDTHKTTSPRALFIKTDVTNWTQLEAAFTYAEESFATLDIVCPGAGVFEPHFSNFWHPPGSPLSRDPANGTASEGIGHYFTLDLNLTHPIRATQLAIARFLQDKASPSNPKRVVHISSIAAQIPALSNPLYRASKHGISGFVRSLAPLEAKTGIRVNGVAPGVIRTPIWTDHPEKLKAVVEGQDKWVEPEEVADALLRCVESEEVQGGFIVEVLKDKTRNVEWRMDPGPEGEGGTASGEASLDEEVWTWLMEPGWGELAKVKP